MFIEDSAKPALYASGGTSGLVLDCGYTSTRVVPFYQGNCAGYNFPYPRHGRMEMGGYHITQFMQRLLRESGIGQIDEHVANDIKEKSLS